MESRKVVTDEPIFRTGMETRDVENGLVSPAMDEEGGTNWESGMEIHTRPRVKQAAGGKLLRSPGSSALCSVMT